MLVCESGHIHTHTTHTHFLIKTCAHIHTHTTHTRLDQQHTRLDQHIHTQTTHTHVSARTHTHTHNTHTRLHQQQGACLGGVALLLASVFACLYFKSKAQKQEESSINESDLESDDDWSVDAEFVYGKTLPVTSLPVCILNFTITCSSSGLSCPITFTDRDID